MGNNFAVRRASAQPSEILGIFYLKPNLTPMHCPPDTGGKDLRDYKKKNKSKVCKEVLPK
jgi:hypothetical protein